MDNFLGHNPIRFNYLELREYVGKKKRVGSNFLIS